MKEESPCRKAQWSRRAAEPQPNTSSPPTPLEEGRGEEAPIGLWGMYQWLDRAPKGRNETKTGIWWRRHDEYERLPQKAASCCHGAEART